MHLEQLRLPFIKLPQFRGDQLRQASWDGASDGVIDARLLKCQQFHSGTSVSDLCMSRTVLQEACQAERLLLPCKMLQEAADCLIIQSFRTAFPTLAS